MIAKKYNDLLKKLTPFVLSFEENFKSFDLSALNTPVDESNCYKCTDLSSEEFYLLLRQTDQLTFGDQAMAMEGWTYFDCSAMPGAIVGFGLPVNIVPKDLLSKFKIPNNYQGIIPVSMFIAIPMVGNRWFGHNLCSLSKFLGDDYKGLGLLTKAFGIEVLKIEEMFGATQWGSHAINIHSKLAPMRLRSTVTPIHTHRNTLAYSSKYSKEGILRALNDSNNVVNETFFIESTDVELQKELQARIQNGDELYIVGKPKYENKKVFYKIRESLQ